MSKPLLKGMSNILLNLSIKFEEAIRKFVLLLGDKKAKHFQFNI